MSTAPPVPGHLADAWRFVHGDQWCFEALAPGDLPLVKPALALTVALERSHAAPGLLVGCLIQQDDAEALARHMFNAPDGDLSPDDVRDAGQEACNLLAGSVLADRPDRSELQIGLPRCLTLSQYETLAREARLHAGWVGRPSVDDTTARVVLALFDPPATPPAQDQP